VRLRARGSLRSRQPTISHHLKILRKAGVLTSERRGTWIYYGLDPALREQLLDFAGVLGK
jgi:ArsR family transcriptional regulator